MGRAIAQALAPVALDRHSRSRACLGALATHGTPAVTATELDLQVAQEWQRFNCVIPGDPVAKGRPRLGTVNGHAMAFTPAKTRRYEDIVRQTAIREWAGRPLIADAAIYLHLHFFRSIPASWPKKRQLAAQIGQIAPTGRPDLDNCVKAITDGLNGVVYLDDALIVTLTAGKLFDCTPRVEIFMEWRPGTSAQRHERPAMTSEPDLLPERPF